MPTVLPRPYVTVSYGQSLDGRIATRTGDSQWIGGALSLQLAHELRRDNEVILVGIGTVLRDNPRLTCRLPGGRNPTRVVLDSDLRIPVNSALVTGIAEAPTWVICRAGADADRRRTLESLGVDVHEMADLPALLAWLTSRGISTVFVEGGAQVITAFLGARLVDRLLVVTAPFVIGTGIEAIGNLNSTVLAEVERPLRWRRWELGDDLATELIYREFPGTS
ncbi:MAG: RibD family protein [Spirochaetales bacterium]